MTWLRPASVEASTSHRPRDPPCRQQRKQINIVSAMLAQWRTNVMRSKVEPMKEVAKMIRNHFDGIVRKTAAGDKVDTYRQLPFGSSKSTFCTNHGD
jgi:hypothetical protein